MEQSVQPDFGPHPNEMLVRHILDSIVVAPYLQGERFIDVGTGPGLQAFHSLSCVLKPISLCWIALVNACVSSSGAT
ncbi:RsmG family class I SAM-dependent methyltransferase [Shigella flexneri]